MNQYNRWTAGRHRAGGDPCIDVEAVDESSYTVKLLTFRVTIAHHIIRLARGKVVWCIPQLPYESRVLPACARPPHLRCSRYASGRSTPECASSRTPEGIAYLTLPVLLVIPWSNLVPEGPDCGNRGIKHKRHQGCPPRIREPTVMPPSVLPSGDSRTATIHALTSRARDSPAADLSANHWSPKASSIMSGGVNPRPVVLIDPKPIGSV